MCAICHHYNVVVVGGGGGLGMGVEIIAETETVLGGGILQSSVSCFTD